MSLGGTQPHGRPGGVDFDCAEVVANDPSSGSGLARPIGWRVRLADGSAAWDKSGPGDTNWSSVGGSTSGSLWRAKMLGRSQALAGTSSVTIDTDFFADGLVDDLSLISVGGTPSKTWQSGTSGLQGGQTVLNSSTTANSIGFLAPPSTQVIADSQSGRTWSVASRVKVSTKSAQTLAYCCGMFGPQIVIGGSVKFGVIGTGWFGGAGSDTNYSLAVVDAGGVSTIVVSSIAIDLTAMHDFEIHYNKTTGTILAYVDGVFACGTTDLTHLVTTLAMPAIGVLNGTEALSRIVVVDKLWAGTTSP